MDVYALSFVICYKSCKVKSLHDIHMCSAIGTYRSALESQFLYWKIWISNHVVWRYSVWINLDLWSLLVHPDVMTKKRLTFSWYIWHVDTYTWFSPNTCLINFVSYVNSDTGFQSDVFGRKKEYLNFYISYPCLNKHIILLLCAIKRIIEFKTNCWLFDLHETVNKVSL